MTDQIRQIADRMRSWRLESGWTLQELADRSGVSASAIHKIENHQTVPTIRVLLQVASGLGRQPHQLFDTEAKAPNGVAVLRAQDRQTWAGPNGVDLEKVIGPIGGALIDLWRIRHAAGTSSDTSRPEKPWRRYEGEVVLLVESGQLTVGVGDEEWELGPGDTIHLNTLQPHRWANRSEQDASLLIFSLTRDAVRTANVES
ncbi:XRE family transcriptional regulator [Myxococcota bacterium]|nr:XRE family transcriptional regulator [Myxococcota bacterium]